MARQTVDNNSQQDITFSPTLIDTGCQDHNAYLVLLDKRLIAILVRLDDEDHGLARGRLFLEVGFGPYAAAMPRCFSNTDEARDWFQERSHLSVSKYDARAAHGSLTTEIGVLRKALVLQMETLHFIIATIPNGASFQSKPPVALEEFGDLL